MQDRWPTAWQIFGLAFALRFGVAVLLPNIHHPDEIFQSFEQAHRVVFGNGLVPWEFRTGARSWLTPGLLMGPMWIGKWLAPGTDLFRWLSQALLAAMSSLTAVVAWRWGQRSGPVHAFIAAIAVAVWFEFVYFGAKAFSEVIASVFLFTAAWLCAANPSRGQEMRPVLAGLCLGLTLAFRFHLAPAVLFIAWWGFCRLPPGGRVRLLCAACAPILLLGALDWLTWGEPFASVIRNYTANITQGVSNRYGRSPTGWYPLQLMLSWDLALPILLVLAAWRAWRQPLPMFVALLILVSHSLIAHKEYRFIYPALPMLVFLAAEGSADACLLLTRRFRTSWSAMNWGTCVALAWVLLSATLAVAGPSQTAWFRARGGLELLSAARDARACGVAISGLWPWSGGYSRLHVDVPLHLLLKDNRVDWDTRSFNAWITSANENGPRESGYSQQTCVTERVAGIAQACLWIRPGACEAHQATEAQRVMESVAD